MNTQRNDEPQGKNPDEVGKKEPARKEHAQYKIDIKESELGRELSQEPVDEHIEGRISQIDQGTIDLQSTKDSNHSKSGHSDESASQNSIDDTDNRDNGDGTTDWNAENNESGRRK